MRRKEDVLLLALHLDLLLDTFLLFTHLGDELVHAAQDFRLFVLERLSVYGWAVRLGLNSTMMMWVLALQALFVAARASGRSVYISEIVFFVLV